VNRSEFIATCIGTTFLVVGFIAACENIESRPQRQKLGIAFGQAENYDLKLVSTQYIQGQTIYRLENDEVICFLTSSGGLSCQW
jgi:hypothetical protein